MEKSYLPNIMSQKDKESLPWQDLTMSCSYLDIFHVIGEKIYLAFPITIQN